jgi:hypothetical protein
MVGGRRRHTFIRIRHQIRMERLSGTEGRASGTGRRGEGEGRTRWRDGREREESERRADGREGIETRG